MRRTLPKRIYATPEYREGYAAGAQAARAGRREPNPYMPLDLRHLGWEDAGYDTWSARQFRGGAWLDGLNRPDVAPCETGKMDSAVRAGDAGPAVQS